LDRLDKKYPPYELIWQDSDQLSGKVLLGSSSLLEYIISSECCYVLY
jgi:hypothetical protein